MTWLGPMHQAKRHAKRARQWERHGSPKGAASEWVLCVMWLLSALFEGENKPREQWPCDYYGPLHKVRT